jgi:hypothetical protein
MKPGNYPRGAGNVVFRQDSGGMVNLSWIARHGGRAQRRELLRTMKAEMRQRSSDTRAEFKRALAAGRA